MGKAGCFITGHRRTWSRLLWILFCIPASTSWSAAQLSSSFTFKFDKLNTGDKPVNQSIICIAQDAIGFMWFGTANGLYRYDGVRVEPFEFPELKNVEIYDLLVDSDKNLWIATTWDQLYKYDIYRHTLRHYIYDSASIGSNRTMIYKICQDKNHSLWLASKMGVMNFNTVTATFVHCLAEPARAVVIYHDTVWAGLETGGVKCIDPETRKLLQTPVSWKGLRKDNINGFYHDKRSRLWIATNSGIYMEENHGMLRCFRNGQSISILPDNNVFSVLEDDEQGYTWISTDKGIALYNENRGKFESVESNENNYAAFLTASSNCLYKDAGGKIWVGTLSEGVYSFYPRKIRVYQHNNKLPSIHSDDIRQVFSLSAGILVLVYHDGIDLLNLRKQDCAFYPFHNPLGGAENIIQSSCARNDSSIFIGGRLGLFYFDIFSRRYTAALPSRLNQRLFFVHAAVTDKQNSLWIGSEQGGLFKYDGPNGLLREFKEGEKGLRSAQINELAIDQDGAVVISHFSGFQKYQPAVDSFTVLKKDGKIFFTSAGTCFVSASPRFSFAGSYQEGLFVVDNHFSIVRSIDEQQGIGSNTIWSMMLDKGNSLWVSTSWGVNRITFNRNNFGGDYRISHFDKLDGLPGEIVVNVVEQDIDNRNAYYMATNHGLVEAEPETFHPDSYTAPAIITHLDIDNKRISALDSSHILALPVYLTQEINLDYKQNDFQLSFASFNYIKSQKVRYDYMLKGVDKDWINTSATNSAAYSNLGPGEYTFLLKSANEAGLWNNKPASLQFIIEPPAWKTVWAYILYGIILLLTLYALYRNRVNRLKRKQAAQLHTMVATQEEERKRISRDLHDDVGTKLSALKLYISSLRNNMQKGQYEDAEKLSSNAEELINETMRDVREMLLNLSPTVLEEFGYATAVESLVNKINLARVINFDLSLFGLEKGLPGEYELGLFRITQELINNVLRHSGAKNVSLQVGFRDERIVLMIEDDGKGFELSVQRTGYGLKNLEARSKLMGGVMDIDTRPGNGTRITIEIPFQYKAHANE